MGFFKDLLTSTPTPIVVDHNVTMVQLSGRGRNVRAHGHQPSIVDCPTCLAHPGEPCSGLQKAVYHGPRFTAYKRHVLRERKTARTAATQSLTELVEEIKGKRETAPTPVTYSSQELTEFGRRVAYSELEMVTETISDEVVAEWGWTPDHVRLLKASQPISVVLAEKGAAPVPIGPDDKSVFLGAVNLYIEQRRRELAEG
jgi:hypothetical protein